MQVPCEVWTFETSAGDQVPLNGTVRLLRNQNQARKNLSQVLFDPASGQIRLVKDTPVKAYAIHKIVMLDDAVAVARGFTIAKGVDGRYLECGVLEKIEYVPRYVKTGFQDSSGAEIRRPEARPASEKAE